jgi:hypothetical protein
MESSAILIRMPRSLPRGGFTQEGCWNRELFALINDAFSGHQRHYLLWHLDSGIGNGQLNIFEICGAYVRPYFFELICELFHQAL